MFEGEILKEKKQKIHIFVENHINSL